MSNTQFQPEQRFESSSSQSNSKSPNSKVDEPVGEPSNIDTTAREVGSPVEDEGSKATGDLDEL